MLGRDKIKIGKANPGYGADNLALVKLSEGDCVLLWDYWAGGRPTERVSLEA